MLKTSTFPRPSGFTCPITGSALLFVWKQPGVLDGECRYAAESDPAITYSRDVRVCYFELTSGYPLRRTKIPYTNDPARYFEIDEDNKWQEFYRLAGRHELVKIDTPFEEVEELLKKLRAEDAERRAKWRDGPNLLPLAEQVVASTFSNDLISVQPMSEPTGKLQEFRTRLDHSTLEYTYVSSEVPINYPYLVTQDNLKQTQANFKTEDVVIGDTVDEWDTGGWLQLAGRAGEHIVRNGKVVHTRLTRMS